MICLKRRNYKQDKCLFTHIQATDHHRKIIFGKYYQIRTGVAYIVFLGDKYWLLISTDCNKIRVFSAHTYHEEYQPILHNKHRFHMKEL